MKKLLIILLCSPMIMMAQTSHIVFAGMGYFNPIQLNINIGDTVNWINDDGGYHNVNFDYNIENMLSFNNPESFISNPTNTINMYSHVFLMSGTYHYQCDNIGHVMYGKIIVNNPNSINEQNNTRNIIKIIDLLGKESKQTNQPLFYIYDDGTVEKRIVIE